MILSMEKRFVFPFPTGHVEALVLAGEVVDKPLWEEKHLKALALEGRVPKQICQGTTMWEKDRSGNFSNYTLKLDA